MMGSFLLFGDKCSLGMGGQRAGARVGEGGSFEPTVSTSLFWRFSKWSISVKWVLRYGFFTDPVQHTSTTDVTCHTERLS